MKTRFDFVSNSSTSSWIISKPKVFIECNVSKQDIFDVLLELYGNNAYHSYNNGKSKPFYVYELPNDLDKAIKDYGEFLEQWDQTVPVDQTYRMLDSPGKATTVFNNFLNAVSNAYEAYLCTGRDDELNRCKGNLPDFARITITDVRRKLGVKTSLDVLKDNEAWLFVHFDENEIMNLAGMSDVCSVDVDDYWSFEDIEKAKKSRFTTPCYTLQRMFELMLMKLVEKGKMKAEDVNVDDIIDESCLHSCMHEG